MSFKRKKILIQPVHLLFNTATFYGLYSQYAVIIWNLVKLRTLEKRYGLQSEFKYQPHRASCLVVCRKIMSARENFVSVVSANVLFTVEVSKHFCLRNSDVNLASRICIPPDEFAQTSGKEDMLLNWFSSFRLKGFIKKKGYKVI